MTVKWGTGSPNWADGNILLAADLNDTMNATARPRFTGDNAANYPISYFIMPSYRWINENLLYNKTITPTIGSLAIDGNNNTYAPAGSYTIGSMVVAGSEVLRVDFGAATSGCFSIKCSLWGPGGGYQANIFGDYSIDGTNWTNFDTINTASSTPIVYDLNSSGLPVPFRYVRVRVGPVDGVEANARVYEITAWPR